jgi:hypothetical protein
MEANDVGNTWCLGCIFATDRIDLMSMISRDVVVLVERWLGRG